MLSNLSSHLAQIFNVYISSIGENKVTNYFEILFFVLPFCVTWKRGPLRSIMCSCSLSIHSSCTSWIKVKFSSSYLCGIHLINNMTFKMIFSLLKSLGPCFITLFDSFVLCVCNPLFNASQSLVHFIINLMLRWIDRLTSFPANQLRDCVNHETNAHFIYWLMIIAHAFYTLILSH